jgi:hypothetical protein
MAKYSDDQGRDDHGRWTVGGASVSEIMDRSKWDERGHFMGTVNAATYDPAVIRSEYVTQLGKEWTDRVAENDAEFQGLTEKVSALDDKLATNQRAVDRQSDAVNKFWNTPAEERTDADRAAFDKASGKMDALMLKGGKMAAERSELNIKASERVADWVKQGSVGGPVDHPFWNDNGNGIHPDSELIDARLKTFERTVGGIPQNSAHSGVAVRLLSPDQARAYFSQSENAVYLGREPSQSVVSHEMGHWYEENTPGGRLAALSFLEKRTAGESEKGLNDLASTRFGVQKSYAADEVARPDKFMDSYTGKIYPNARATEVTSMGMQHLSEDPARFLRRDPEHFNFTIGMIRAGRQGGFPWAK